MTITVILCTYNRCQSLGKALESVAASDLPPTVEWEVLVVDNNSADQTREVVEQYRQRYPGRLRDILEKQQRLSPARKAGIREAHGEILAFMDDDVIVERTWLRNLTSRLDHGEWAGAGGRILAAESFTPPRWLAAEGPYAVGGILYAHFDLGDKAGELDRAPYGTNMAYRKAMFEKYGGFRTDLGRCGDSLISLEDTEFGRRLMAAKERLWYEPSAVVFHEVPESRIKKEYLLAWWFDYGRAGVREAGKRPAILGIPRHYISIPHVALSHLPQRVVRWMLALNPQARFSWKCGVWAKLGELSEMHRLAFDSKRQSQKYNVQT